jgi:hypothetical protein
VVTSRGAGRDSLHARGQIVTGRRISDGRSLKPILRVTSTDRQPRYRHCVPPQSSGDHRHHSVDQFRDRNAEHPTVVPTRAAHPCDPTRFPESGRSRVLCQRDLQPLVRLENAGHFLGRLCLTGSSADAAEHGVDLVNAHLARAILLSRRWSFMPPGATLTPETPIDGSQAECKSQFRGRLNYRGDI